MATQSTNTGWVEIGVRIKALRKSLGENQRDFSRILGLWQSAVAKIEAGGRALTIDDITKIHEIFGVDIYWLLTGCIPGEGGLFPDVDIDYARIEVEVKGRRMILAAEQDARRLIENENTLVSLCG